MHPCHTYCCLLRSPCLVSSHNTIYSPVERECSAWWDQIAVVKETMLTAVAQTERKSKLFTYFCPKNIILHNFTMKSKVKLCCISNRPLNQRYIAISNKWRNSEQDKRIIYKRGFLDWLLPIRTLPPVCETHDKIQVVYKEIRHDWIHSKAAKSQFYS